MGRSGFLTEEGTLVGGGGSPHSSLKPPPSGTKFISIEQCLAGLSPRIIPSVVLFLPKMFPPLMLLNVTLWPPPGVYVYIYIYIYIYIFIYIYIV